MSHLQEPGLSAVALSVLPLSVLLWALAWSARLVRLHNLLGRAALIVLIGIDMTSQPFLYRFLTGTRELASDPAFMIAFSLGLCIAVWIALNSKAVSLRKEAESNRSLSDSFEKRLTGVEATRDVPRRYQIAGQMRMLLWIALITSLTVLLNALRHAHDSQYHTMIFVVAGIFAGSLAALINTYSKK